MGLHSGQPHDAGTLRLGWRGTRAGVRVPRPRHDARGRLGALLGPVPALPLHDRTHPGRPTRNGRRRGGGRRAGQGGDPGPQIPGRGGPRGCDRPERRRPALRGQAPGPGEGREHAYSSQARAGEGGALAGALAGARRGRRKGRGTDARGSLGGGSRGKALGGAHGAPRQAPGGRGRPLCPCWVAGLGPGAGVADGQGGACGRQSAPLHRALRNDVPQRFGPAVPGARARPAAGPRGAQGPRHCSDPPAGQPCGPARDQARGGGRRHGPRGREAVPRGLHQPRGAGGRARGLRRGARPRSGVQPRRAAPQVAGLGRARGAGGRPSRHGGGQPPAPRALCALAAGHGGRHRDRGPGSHNGAPLPRGAPGLPRARLRPAAARRH
mmetsp:Transcript_11847/g.40405  ORF Transcript_11847/g.40405 Transcript_11847/m.40405 type:complete len:382 (+) Transcript_11847:223-1368(+)